MKEGTGSRKLQLIVHCTTVLVVQSGAAFGPECPYCSAVLAHQCSSQHRTAASQHLPPEDSMFYYLPKGSPDHLHTSQMLHPLPSSPSSSSSSSPSSSSSSSSYPLPPPPIPSSSSHPFLLTLLPLFRLLFLILLLILSDSKPVSHRFKPVMTPPSFQSSFLSN